MIVKSAELYKNYLYKYLKDGNELTPDHIIKLKDETIVSDGKSLSFSLIVPKRNFYSEDVASEGIYYNEKSTEEELCYEIKCEVIGVKTLKLQPD